MHAAGEDMVARQTAMHLCVLSGNAKGATRPLVGTLRVGTARDNDLVLKEDTVAPYHCEFARAADGVHVRDLGSAAGTRVQGARVSEAIVPPGTVVIVGDVEIALEPALGNLEVVPSDKTWFGAAVGRSLAMRSIFGVLERVAQTDATVLLQGEAGSGKDVLARAIWTESTRAQGPFVVVDCSAVSCEVLESDLFGDEGGGGLSDSRAARQGAFELAGAGTLFLDEVAELTLDLQPKLSRVLQTKEFRRVGAGATLRADARVIASTRRPLQREVQAGKFLQGLYSQLAVIPIAVPPLRSHREDIPVLAEHFLKACGTPMTIAQDTMDALVAHDWPGNVRELRNVLERAVDLVRAAGQTELDLISLPKLGVAAEKGVFRFDPDRSYRETRAGVAAEFERRYVKWLLDRHGGNVSAAAREAKMDRKHLHEMAKRHGLRGDSD